MLFVFIFAYGFELGLICLLVFVNWFEFGFVLDFNSLLIGLWLICGLYY